MADDDLPLCELLSAALVAFVLEADAAAEQRIAHQTTRHGATGSGPRVWLTSLAMWFNCLRWLADGELTVAELGERARTRSNLPGMRRWGYLRVTPPPPSGRPGAIRRDMVLSLTRRGAAAEAVWAQLPAEIEARWRERVGAAAVDRLRTALISLAVQANAVAQLDADGIALRELPGRTGVSAEGMAMALKVLERTGCITSEPLPGRGRQARLTARGTRARTAGARRLATVEDRFADRCGRPAIEVLRTALTPLVGDATRAGSPLFAGLEPHPDSWRARVPRPSDCRGSRSCCTGAAFPTAVSCPRVSRHGSADAAAQPPRLSTRAAGRQVGFGQGELSTQRGGHARTRGGADRKGRVGAHTPVALEQCADVARERRVVGTRDVSGRH